MRTIQWLRSISSGGSEMKVSDWLKVLVVILSAGMVVVSDLYMRARANGIWILWNTLSNQR